MRYSDSKISRFESGQLPDFHVLTAMLDLYGLTVNDWEPILAEWDRANEPDWWSVYRLADVSYVSMEHAARSVRESQPSFIPGLFQTEAYAHAALTRSATMHSARWIDKQIAVRMRRQERLTGDRPLVYEVIIQESALRRRDTDPAIHRVQLRQIIDHAGRPNVTVRVIPEAAGTHDGLLGPLILLQFPDAEDPDIAYAEHALGANHTTDSGRVSVAKHTMDHLAGLAFRPAESIEFIERMADCL
jgi:hypothetical protein